MIVTLRAVVTLKTTHGYNYNNTVDKKSSNTNENDGEAVVHKCFIKM